MFSSFAAVAIIILRTPNQPEKIAFHLLDRDYSYWLRDTGDNTDDTDFDLHSHLAGLS